jgi:hypothetical protein
MASYHGKSTESRSAKRWYVSQRGTLLLRILTYESWLGTRHKPIHQATIVSSVQKDSGITQETACVYTDGRVLQDGEYYDVRLLEEGLSSTSFRDGIDPPPRRHLPTPWITLS